jgi:hypothetical protein
VHTPQHWVSSTRFEADNAWYTCRQSVSYFKASVVGFHISDHGLDPEDEVAALRNIMSKFEQSVDEAKRSVSPAGARAGAQQQMLDGSEP